MILKMIKTFFHAYRVLSESELFDKQFYSASYHVPRNLAVLHYFLLGKKLGTNPSEEFDSVRYLNTYPGIKKSKQPALYHYLNAGYREGRIYEDTSGNIAHCPLLRMFDGKWYADTYLVKKRACYVAPLTHYLKTGWKEKYLPFPEFDMKRFVADHPECDEEPLHYWYRMRLPELYILDPVKNAFVVNRLSGALELAVHYVQNAHIDLFLNSQAESSKLTVLLAPTPDDASVGTLFDFQTYYEQCLQRGESRVVAVTVPGQRCLTGQGVFSEGLPIFRYSLLLNRIQAFSSVEMVMYESRAFLMNDFLRFNTDDVITHVPYRTVRILNTYRNGDLFHLRALLHTYFQEVIVQDRLIQEPGDCPLFGLFDAAWYHKTYQEGTSENKQDSKEHYLTIGWRKHYLPFEFFDIDCFYRDNPACNVEPLYYCFREKIEKYYFTKRSIPQMKLNERAGIALQMLYRQRQDVLIEQYLPYNNQNEKLMILMVSPEDAISGGIMSFYGIYHYSRQLEQIHHRTVISVSIPGNTTHAGFTMFNNDMPVFRYDMVIRRMRHAKDVLLMVPELYVATYLEYLRNNSDDPVLQTPIRHFNILNQKIEIMPEPEVLQELSFYFPKITQTVAHYKYCTQKERNYYGIPQHLLLPPIIKDFTKVPFEKKEEIFAYSYDEAPWKEKMLSILKKEFPQMMFVEIKGMMFDEYLALIHRAKWCMTFGEGLDGYFSEPYQTGGISFAVWNDVYFTERYHHLPTVLDSVDDALNRLPNLIRSLNNAQSYEYTSNLVREVHNQEYATGYTSLDQLRNFFEGHYDFA